MAQPSHPLAGKHIIVAGGGLAGLACVRSLKQNWPKDVTEPTITVYERDPRQLPSRRGNYSLGLRSDTGGLQALQKLGLLDDVFANRTPGTDVRSLIMRDAQWNTILEFSSPSTPPDGLPAADMRITRLDLRESLTRGVEGDVEIHWGMGCNAASQLDNGRMEVELSDGTKQHCDFLIVSDGASSRIRKSLLPDDTLNYAGVILIGGHAKFASPEAVPEKLREGYGPVVGGDGHSLFIFQIEPSSYVWFVTRRSAEPGNAVKDEEALAMKDEIIQQALDHGKVFGEPFPSIIAATDSESLKIVNAQDKPPIEHAKVTSLPVVFIGDANHAVSPFAGNGANMAIKDGLSLGESLCSASSIESAITAFDRESLPRCRKSLRISHIVIWAAHSTGWAFAGALIFWKMVNWFT